MGLEMVSNKRNRVYVRKFDHEEAQRLFAEGHKAPALAERFGVSTAAVMRVVDPKIRRRMDQQTQTYARRKRALCKGGCGRRVWAHGQNKRTGYCQKCYLEELGKGFARDGELRCSECGEWKPDDRFPRVRSRGSLAPRRGRKSGCVDCDTKRRRKYRKAHPEREREVNRKASDRKMKERYGMNTYVVLEKNGDGGYHELQRVQAASLVQAVELSAKGEGDFVAVLESRFQPMHVEPVVRLSVVSTGADS